MALVTGEVYRCGQCGCEITVTQSADPGRGGNQNPTCCSGHPMTKVH